MIEVRNLTKKFDDFTAVDNLSLTVHKGSIYGLVGVNGSGKTTVIKHITGVLRADSGDIFIGGEKVWENPEVKAKISSIPDNLSFLNSYSLKTCANYFSGLFPDWDWDRYRKMTEKLGLNEKKRLVRFSKGMKKQAAFILAMSTKPEVLILDEPLDGLDPLVRRRITKYIMEDVADREMTVLVSSHNLRELEGICDSVGILSSGRMLIEKDLDDLKADVSKVQVVFPEGRTPDFSGLDVLYEEKRGSVSLLIIKGDKDEVDNKLRAMNPVVVDVLPLSLEEIFIYEAGGENDEFKELLF